MSQALYFSRIQRRLSPDLRWNPYRTHQQLWRLFPKDQDANRDFLYRYDLDRGGPRFYVVSMRLPQSRQGWLVESRSYAPILKSGQRLFFNLRANPIVTKRDEADKRHRHDVVMAYKKEHPDWHRHFTNGQLMEKVGLDWLETRAESNGFRFDRTAVRVEAYRKHRFNKNKAQGKPISVNTLDFQGLLEVVDPDNFKRALYNGIGRGKAFGCGLMLVKPA